MDVCGVTLIRVFQSCAILNPRTSSALERVGKLQEQAAVGRDSLPGLQARQDVYMTSLALADAHQALGKLVGSRSDVEEGLIFGGPKDCRIRHSQRVFDRARLDAHRHVEVFLQLCAWILRDN